MPIQLLTPRVIAEAVACLLIAAAVWFAYSWVYDRGAVSVQTQWDAEKLAIAQQSAKVTQDALNTTKTLAAAVDKQRSDANDQIKNLNANLAGAIAGLQHRPERSSSSSVSSNPADPKGCYPAQLYREDATVALRLAGEADTLRIELAACYKSYDAARAALNK